MQEGFTPLPDSLLTQAFMRREEDSQPLRRSSSRVRSQSARRLSQKAALTADLFHAQLVRKGVQHAEQVAWATGALPSALETIPSIMRTSRQQTEVSAQSELSEEVLEALHGLLGVASKEEGRFFNSEQDETLVPAEMFLQSLVWRSGPLKVLQLRVETALHIAHFSTEVSAVEHALEVGLKTMHTILSSSAMPILLEGVLLLGNYVNSSSKTLSGAVGITLDSLAKLAHTRCLPDQVTREQGKRRTSKSENALLLLVRHLQETHPGFMSTLSRDIEGCKPARDLDPKALEQEIVTLAKRVTLIEDRIQQASEGTLAAKNREQGCSEEEPEALKLDRMQTFVAMAQPRVQLLQERMQEFKEAVAAMRQYFAESADASFHEMIRNLDMLREVFPPSRPQALPAYPRPCRLRHVGRSQPPAPKIRSKSAPPVQQDGFKISVPQRCSSEPPSRGANRNTATNQRPVPLAPAHQVKMKCRDRPTSVRPARKVEVVTQPGDGAARKVEVVTQPGDSQKGEVVTQPAFRRGARASEGSSKGLQTSSAGHRNNQPRSLATVPVPGIHLRIPPEPAACKVAVENSVVLACEGDKEQTGWQSRGSDIIDVQTPPKRPSPLPGLPSSALKTLPGASTLQPNQVMHAGKKPDQLTSPAKTKAHISLPVAFSAPQVVGLANGTTNDIAVNTSATGAKVKAANLPAAFATPCIASSPGRQHEF
jgi:hypothetical protein